MLTCPTSCLAGQHGDTACQSCPDVLRIIIPVAPTGQMRPRLSTRGGFARAHKDAKQESREATIKAYLATCCPPEPFTGPLVLGVRAYMPIPASWSKSAKHSAAMGTLRPTSKPDLDNAVKQIKDCLTQMQFWGDDRQVVEFAPGTGKYYSTTPRWEIEIRRWMPDWMAQ